MEKKIQALALCVLLSISAAACSGQGSQDLLKDSLNAGQAQEEGVNSQDITDGGPDSQGVQEGSGADSPGMQEESGADSLGSEEEGDAQEPILSQDATDDELLEVIKDDITVVTDGNYIEMIEAFTEHTEEHAGQIYQLEGIYTVENGSPYVTRTIVDGDDKASCGLPLKYVPQEPEEGTWVRVTGIINEGEVNGETAVVLEVVVLQSLDGQGQAELPAQG